jgi:hypothetical protein
MGHLPPEAVRKITYENAARLYRLDPMNEAQAIPVRGAQQLEPKTWQL